MKHRPTAYTLNILRNEVPGGVELADEAGRGPQQLQVSDTQLKFMEKFDLVDHHGDLRRLVGSAIVLVSSR